MTDSNLIKVTRPEAAEDRLRRARCRPAHEAHSPGSTEAHLARIEKAVRPEKCARLPPRRPSRAPSRRPRAVDEKREAGREARPRSPAFPSRSRTSFTTRGHPDHGRLRRSSEGWIPPVRRDPRPRSCKRGRRRPSSARPTWTSSPWGPPPRTAPTAPPATRGTSRGSPAVPGAAPRRPRLLPGAARHRDRHRRLHPPARRRHRDGRRQAHLRRRLAASAWSLSSSPRPGGPCARTVLDAALLHEVIAGHDPLDSTSPSTRPCPAVVEAARKGASARACASASSSSSRGEGYQAGVMCALRRGRRRTSRSRGPRRRAGLPHLRP